MEKELKMEAVNSITQNLSLYLHFPFCKQKCFYCDFNSYSGLEELMPDYYDSLILELQRFLPQTKIIRSVYFGGGTPSYYPVELLVKILNFIKTHFRVSQQTEITIEANPGTVTVEDLLQLKEAGFNRLSLGLQAVQDEMLQQIGRIHNWNDFLHIYELAREVGFTNIGVDLIFGLPNQSVVEWQDTLQRIIDINPEHISAYGLQLEMNTPLARMVETGVLQLPDENDTVSMMSYTMEFLRRNGYEHYEISNYGKPGYRSIHNLAYWTGQDYLGFGAGAASTYHQERWVNLKDPRKYIQALKNGTSFIESSETIDSTIRITEALMLGLRLRAGVNIDEFQKQFHVDIEKIVKLNLASFLEKKLIKIKDDKLMLTDDGVLISNYVIATILGVL